MQVKVALDSNVARNYVTVYNETNIIKNGLVTAMNETDKKKKEGRNWTAEERKGMYVYECKSCGGEIIGDETFGAARCPYCGNTVDMKEPFSGGLRPDLIIPFSKTKEEAIRKLERHVRRSIFAPKEYQSRDILEEVRGVYVPFWLYNTEADFDMKFASRMFGQSRRKGDYICQEYKDYHIYKAGKIDFQDVPVDASAKISDDLMASLEPFDMKDAVAFNPIFMAGYAMDRYDTGKVHGTEQLNARIEDFVHLDVRNELKEYENVQYLDGHVQVGRKKARYILLPVWMLSSTWNGKVYTYAMNGQTGKVTGRIPVDPLNVRKYWFKYSVIFSVIVFIISLIGFSV